MSEKTGNVNSIKKKQERGTDKTEKKRRKETMEAWKKRVQEVKKTTDRNLLTYLHTYLLTPWSRVRVEKLTSLLLVKKFPAFYGTRRFITATCPYTEPARSSPYPHIPLP
jgi:hypothetical protein